MGFKESIRTCLREKYFTFSGRASRSEYWYYNLFLVLVVLAYILILVALNGLGGLRNGEFSTFFLVVAAIGGLGILYIYIPVLSAGVRRYHDIGLSGWVFLAVFVLSNVPYLGVLVGIGGFVILVRKSNDGDNKYGHDPLKIQSNADVFA